MKVKCISVGLCDFITVGETYEVIVIDTNDNGYYIINNDDKYWWYPNEYFKTLSEIRNETINY